MNYKMGQRWMSMMEPELGLGIVTAVDQRAVHISFPAARCQRQYAMLSAPIKRVRFSIGDTIQTNDGHHHVVDDVIDTDNILTYQCHSVSIPEMRLSDILSFSTPKERLLGGFVDPNITFEVRLRIRQLYSEYLKSASRGFTGPRLELIPHQFYVAYTVSQMPVPRVLLSDEVGLGKTIEACLILHRLLATERIHRVLILVPDSLIYQWFVELLRKFNLLFRIMDADFCESIFKSSFDTNPFLDDPLCIASIDYISQSEHLYRDVIEADWELVIVDEAHHLSEGRPLYQMVETLCEKTPGCILITATPQQLGQDHHFARLKLLDPMRYPDFQLFLQESEQYEQIGQLVGKLMDHAEISGNEKKFLSEISSVLPDFDNQKETQKIINLLLDRYGVGRVMFRNTRRILPDFHVRQVHIQPLQADASLLPHFFEEYEKDLQDSPDESAYDYTGDPRITWIVDLIKNLKDEKILLICRSVQKVKAIAHALIRHIRIDMALFHEQLSIIQRDKNAAWFAKKEGARLLLCSEIGSEGRNFQFVHHLILFDVPFDPEKLEQRIGRLDRIGQHETVQLYVAYIEKTPQSVWINWFHQGLNAFRKNVPGGYEIYQEMESKIKAAALSGNLEPEVIRRTRKRRDKIQKQLEKGRDRLLELYSFDPVRAEQTIQQIKISDDQSNFPDFVNELLQQFGIELERLSEQIYRVHFDTLDDPSFPIPPLREEQLLITFDRDTANHREDLEFLTWDHPMIQGAVDLILGSTKGNCTAVLWQNSGKDGFLLDVAFIVECIAPAVFHINRFVPPTLFRIVVNHQFEDMTQEYASFQMKSIEKTSAPKELLSHPGVKALIPRMILKAENIIKSQIPSVRRQAVQNIESYYETEINRLKLLRKVNPNIRKQDIQILENDQQALFDAVQTLYSRLDALRFIIMQR